MAKKQVIVVDDERDIAEYIGDVIEDEGFKPLLTHSAKDCLDLVRREKVVGLFMDIVMPEEDCIELLKDLSATNTKLPIILMSGYDQTYLKIAETIGQAKGLLIIGTLTKPFSADEVSTVIRAMDVSGV